MENAMLISIIVIDTGEIFARVGVLLILPSFLTFTLFTKT